MNVVNGMTTENLMKEVQTDSSDEFSEKFSSVDSEEVSSGEEENKDLNLSEKLKNWAVQFRISLTALLVLLTSHIAGLPTDA